MAAAENRLNSPQLSGASQQEYALLVRNYQKLKDAYRAEQDKSAKLRRYIARMNQTQSAKDVPTTSPMDQKEKERLESLVEEQSNLLDQLYQENTQHRASLDRVTKANKQLLIANDKLRQSLLELKKRFKSALHSTQSNEHIDAGKAAQSNKTAQETKKSWAFWK